MNRRLNRAEAALRKDGGIAPGSYDPDRLPDAARQGYDALLAQCPIDDDGVHDPSALTPADRTHLLMLAYECGDATCRAFLRDAQPRFAAWLVMRYGK